MLKLVLTTILMTMFLTGCGQKKFSTENIEMRKAGSGAIDPLGDENKTTLDEPDVDFDNMRPPANADEHMRVLEAQLEEARASLRRAQDEQSSASDERTAALALERQEGIEQGLQEGSAELDELQSIIISTETRLEEAQADTAAAEEAVRVAEEDVDSANQRSAELSRRLEEANDTLVARALELEDDRRRISENEALIAQLENTEVSPDAVAQAENEARISALTEANRILRLQQVSTEARLRAANLGIEDDQAEVVVANIELEDEDVEVRRDAIVIGLSDVSELMTDNLPEVDSSDPVRPPVNEGNVEISDLSEEANRIMDQRFHRSRLIVEIDEDADATLADDSSTEVVTEEEAAATAEVDELVSDATRAEVDRIMDQRFSNSNITTETNDVVVTTAISEDNSLISGTEDLSTQGLFTDLPEGQTRPVVLMFSAIPGSLEEVTKILTENAVIKPFNRDGIPVFLADCGANEFSDFSGWLNFSNDPDQRAEPCVYKAIERRPEDYYTLIRIPQPDTSTTRSFVIEDLIDTVKPIGIGFYTVLEKEDIENYEPLSPEFSRYESFIRLTSKVQSTTRLENGDVVGNMKFNDAACRIEVFSKTLTREDLQEYDSYRCPIIVTRIAE